MKSKLKTILTIGSVSLAIWMGTTLYINAESASSQGSVNDPLITKSYMDEQLAVLVKQEVSKLTSSQTNSNAPGAVGSTISVIQLKSGQTLYAAAGTELIVRTGKTLAVSSDTNGIPDVTEGVDIAPNAPIQTNHMLVFPREGRGIKPDPKNTQDIFVMVRGDYTLYNADGTKVTP